MPTDDEILEAMARAIAKERNAMWPSDANRYRRYADAALAAHDEWRREQGVVMVPVEPTQEAVDAIGVNERQAQKTAVFRSFDQEWSEN